MITATPFYDPTKTFDDNFDNGPFPSPGEPFTNPDEPTHTVLGHKVYTPFGIPAGPLPTSKHIKYAFERGFDVLCYKTQRSTPFACNEFPNILYVDPGGDLTPERASQPLVGATATDKPAPTLSITNSFGNPSRGPEFWVDDLKKAISYQGKGQLLIMSVVGTIQDGFTPEQYYDDFAATAALAADAGAPAIEVNLSCPNVANEGVLCYTPDAAISICKKVRERIGRTPLVIKLGYFSNQQNNLLESILAEVAPYIDAVSAINTISAPIVDENGTQALPGPNRLKSGVCGASIKWAGLDMVRRLKQLRDKRDWSYEIFGVGGVMTPKDYQQYLNAGADVVQSATGAMWNQNLAAEIKSLQQK